MCRDLRNEDGLILSAIHHSLEGTLGNGEDMRWNLIPPLSHVDLHGSLGVDGEPLKVFSICTNNIAHYRNNAVPRRQMSYVHCV